MNTLKHNRVGCEEQVKQAVDEGHIDGQQQNDGFREEKPHGTREILGDELSEIYLNLLLLSVDPPVLGSSSKLGGFGDQDDGRVGFLEEEEVQAKCGEAHDGRNPVIC